MFTPQREHRHHDTSRPPRLLLHPQRLTIGNDHRTVGNTHLIGSYQALRRAVVTLLPGYQGMRRIVDNDILVLYRQRDSIHIDGQQPVVASQILHPQIACRIPAAQSRMTADNGHRLSGLQLRRRHAKQDRLAVQRHAQGLDLLVARHMFHRLVGTTVKMILQGNLPPLVSQNVILRRVKVIDTGNGRPFATEHVLISVFHLIIVREGGYRMLA